MELFQIFISTLLVLNTCRRTDAVVLVNDTYDPATIKWMLEGMKYGGHMWPPNRPEWALLKPPVGNSTQITRTRFVS
jgi:hypothetical protein